MARLVFGMNQSLDGCVDHMAFAPGPTLFCHFFDKARQQVGSVYGLEALTMSAIVVRPARADDLPFTSQDSYVGADRVARQIDAGEVWIAEHAAVPCGYLCLEYLWGRVPFIALIRVLPEYRGRGVGRALLSAVEQAVSAAGHPWLYSSSQADEAEPQAWHRHMGFVECGFLAGVNAGGIGEIFFRRPASASN